MKLSYFQIALITSVTLALSMVYLDMAALSVALPTIQSDFNTTRALVQWTINIYLLVGATLTFALGKTSDLFGHKRILLVGLLFFIIASLFCAFAPNIELLIAFRAFQGIGAAMIIIASMSLVAMGIPEEDRGKVIGIIASISLGVMAAAPFIGGVIVDYLSWRWLFILNVILGIITILPILKVKSTDQSKKTTLQHYDYKGFIASAIFVLSINIALNNSASWGYVSLRFITLIALGVIALIILLIIESKSKNPLIDLKLFKLPNFGSALSVAAITQINIYFIVFITVFIQNALGYSAFIAGLLLLPLTVTGMLCSNIGGYLTDKVGTKIPLLIGTGVMTLGFLITLSFYQHMSYITLLPLLIFSGVGMFMINNPARTSMLNQTPKDKYGMTNAIFSGLRQISGVIGFAMIAAIITHTEFNQAKTKLLAHFSNITDTQVQNLLGVLSNTSSSTTTLNQFSSSAHSLIKNIILSSYLYAFRWALIFVGSLMLLAFLVSLLFVKKKSRLYNPKNI